MNDHGNAPAPLMVSVSGCRGIVGASLTPATVAGYAGAVAASLRATAGGRAPTVVLGRDGRAGGEAVKLVAAGALAAAGCRVIDIGVATTPSTGVMVRALKADGGMVVTASHNPAEWNGLKGITSRGCAPPPEEARAIAERFRSPHPSAPHSPHERLWAPFDGVGEVLRDDTAEARHVDAVLGALERIIPVSSLRQALTAGGFRAVVDSVNCAGAAPARRLLETLGCPFIHLNADGSGRFTHPPEPTEAHLTDLASAVRLHKADIGFAQDPDADRLALIDETGRYIGEEYTLVLGVWAVLSAMGDAARGVTVAANLSTSRMIDDVAARFGASVLRTPVGEANLAAVMLERGSAAGGEGNGGIIWPAVVPIRDSISGIALTLALMARERRPLSRLVASVPSYAIEKRKMPIRDGLAERAIAAVKRHWAGSAAMDEQDGLRLDFPAAPGRGPAWLHVRPSNTEPIFRLIAEAPTADAARAILDEADRTVAAV
ncbi:MAG: phosphoglucosamine mutase [Phycisphaerales bacterium]|nr:phosphoglucosamine mutase [Phycisphaerales bacterium]